MEPGYLRSPPPKKSKECKSPREQGAGGKKSLVVRVLAWLSDLRAILYSVLSHGRGLKPRLAQKACFEEASSNAQPGKHQSHQGTIQGEAITNMHYGLRSRFSTYLRLHYRVTIQELGNAKIVEVRLFLVRAVPDRRFPFQMTNRSTAGVGPRYLLSVPST